LKRIKQKKEKKEGGDCLIIEKPLCIFPMAYMRLFVLYKFSHLFRVRVFVRNEKENILNGAPDTNNLIRLRIRKIPTCFANTQAAVVIYIYDYRF